MPHEYNVAIGPGSSGSTSPLAVSYNWIAIALEASHLEGRVRLIPNIQGDGDGRERFNG